MGPVLELGHSSGQLRKDANLQILGAMLLLAVAAFGLGPQEGLGPDLGP